MVVKTMPISTRKANARFLPRSRRNAGINGVIPSEALIKNGNRIGRRKAKTKEPITDDVQFKGKAFKGNGSTIQAESGEINTSGVSKVRFKLVCKLNDLSNQSIISWNGNTSQYILLNYDHDDVFEVVRRMSSGTQQDHKTTLKGKLDHWYTIDLTVTETGFDLKIDDFTDVRSGLTLVNPTPNGNLVLCGYRTTDGANSTASIASAQLWLDDVEQVNYLIEETTGSTLKDYSSNGNDATILNMVDANWEEDGRVSSLLNDKGYNPKDSTFFEKSNIEDSDTARSTEFANIMNNADFSICTKIQIGTELANGIYDITSNSGGVSSGLYFYISSGRVFALKHMSGGNHSTSSSEDLRDGLEHEIILSYNHANGSFRLFIDGVESVYATQSSGSGNNVYSSASHWSIGRYRKSASDRNFLGYIKDLRFYNTEVTPANIGAAIPVSQPQVRKNGTVIDLYGGSSWNSTNLTDRGGNSASLLVPENDILGIKLKYPGTLATRAQLVNANAIRLNGANQAWTPGNLPAATDFNNLSYSCRFKFKDGASPTAGHIIMGRSKNASGSRHSINARTGDDWAMIAGSDGTVTPIPGLTVSEFIDGKWHYLEHRINVGQNKQYFTLDEYTHEGSADVTSSPNDFTYGASNGWDGLISSALYHADIDICDARVWNTTTGEVYYSAEGETGEGSTVNDSSGNGNDAKVENATPSTLWTKQSVFHSVFYNGGVKRTNNGKLNYDARYWLYNDKGYLDQLLGSELGWHFSFFKRYAGFTGTVAVLRNVVSGATFNLTFTGDVIDWNATDLQAFVAGAEIEVIEFFNQMPVANRLFNSVTAPNGQGPTIYENGSWNFHTGTTIPCLDFNGIDEYFEATIDPSQPQQKLYQGNAAEYKGSGNNYVQNFAHEAFKTPWQLMGAYPGGTYRNDAITTGVFNGEAIPNNLSINGYQELGTGRLSSQNGEEIDSSDTAVNLSPGMNRFYIGRLRGNEVLCGNVRVSESYGFLADKSFVRTAIETIVAKSYEKAEFEILEGYEKSLDFNAASDIQFPDIYSVSADLRGTTIPGEDISKVVTRNINSKNGCSIVLTDSNLSDTEKKRQGLSLDIDITKFLGSELGWFLSLMRRRNPLYTGPAFTLRRDSDSATRDVFFDDGGYVNFNDPDLLSWVAGTTVKVKTIYNQYPAANRLFESIEEIAVGKGPTIYENGAWKVLTGTSTVTAFFNGIDQGMRAINIPAIAQQKLLMGMVAEATKANTYCFQSLNPFSGATAKFQRINLKDTVTLAQLIDDVGVKNAIGAGVGLNVPALVGYQENESERNVSINAESDVSVEAAASFDIDAITTFDLNYQYTNDEYREGNFCEGWGFMDAKTEERFKIERFINYDHNLKVA